MTITLLRPDGVPLTAQQHRQGLAALNGAGSGRPLGGRSGFRLGTPSNVLTATSTTWTLQPCSAMIDPGATTHQGMYGWATDQNVTGAVTAADVTYDRKDIVYIQVNDSSAGDGSGDLSGPVLYAAGTPSATPAAPALPARSFLVGTITVPKVGGGSPTVSLNPARFAAAGAPVPVYSTAERDALAAYDGLEVIRHDKGGVHQYYSGGQWASNYVAPYRQWFAVVTLNLTGEGGFIDVNLPAGLFTVPPIVLITKADQIGAGFTPYNVWSANTTSKVRVGAYWKDNTIAYSIQLTLHVIQANPATAGGLIVP